MINKLLSIKKDNNIIVYNLEFNQSELDEYLKFLSALYGYKEKQVLETLIIDGKALSMGKFDLMKKYCKVDEQYKIVEELEQIDEKSKKAKIEVSAKYYSMISEILRETFMTDEILVNATDLIRLANHLLYIPNEFTFNKLLDLSDKNREWNDPSRGFLNLDEYNRYLDYKKRSINVDNIKLNKFEQARALKDITGIIEKLHSIIKVEQIGMYPIQKDMPVLQEVLQIFGERNESFEFFYGTLEDVPINIDGAIILDKINDKICERYNVEHHEKDIKKKINHYSKVKTFLQF